MMPAPQALLVRLMVVIDPQHLDLVCLRVGLHERIGGKAAVWADRIADATGIDQSETWLEPPVQREVRVSGTHEVRVHAIEELGELGVARVRTERVLVVLAMRAVESSDPRAVWEGQAQIERETREHPDGIGADRDVITEEYMCIRTASAFYVSENGIKGDRVAVHVG